ncbi:Tetratricopeptide TPR_1 repeat-containing protein [Stanieria cyanosphaera PCC 7437]|uniref:Tetratricopeptide TPR_1 repeat-containing protein n=1 Tax=Stanieria cyanosphaera (strain ATCC 29371 / PCC 7437) TaxID=111780 RepID=K9XUK3_STAC7|nr:tetratricopeptide repeat protein [Stanieria cyanosphaera]AFZ36213.1 Tetratricopeptide TPR_1 repeat-containing protein [Stanieria cyanosphaera PCC 7437]
MAQTQIIKPLGFVLQQAGLISPEQVRIALRTQNQLPERKIGEILAIKGWIKPETAYFFAEKWPKILLKSQKLPIGQYFKAAALLNETQIDNILQKQQKTGQKFGAIAVVEGFISQQTLDFFLEQLELAKLLKQENFNFSITNNPRDYIPYIKDYLLRNKNCEPTTLLKLYRQIWHQGEVLASGSNEEIELINSGLIVRKGNKIKIAQSVYKSVLNLNWIEQELVRLQPYGQIRLKLFGLESKASLPYKVLTEVNYWTSKQPFLTQKLYQLIKERESFIPKGKETVIIEELVQNHIIENWQQQIAGSHLQEISDRILNNQHCSPVALLKLYKKVWQQREVSVNNSPEQNELIQIGLLKQEQGKVTVANRIYQTVFNQGWIESQLALLNPSPTNNSAITIVPKTQSAKTKRDYSKISLAFLSLLVLGSLCLFGFNILAKNREAKMFEQANNLLQKQEYQKALAIYNQVLKTNGNYYQAWTNRGYALAGLKQYDKMLQSCVSATVIQPQADYAWNCQGEALHNLKQYQQSLVAFDKAIAINPKEAIFLINKSDSLNKLQQEQAALDTINQAIEILENSQESVENSQIAGNLKVAFYYKGQTLLRQQQYQEALQAYQQALQYDPNYLPAQWGKGIALKKLKRYSEATSEFNQILQRLDLSATQRATTWFYLGLNLCDAMNLSEAIEAFQTAIELQPNYEAAQTAQARCQAKLN